MYIIKVKYYWQNGLGQPHTYSQTNILVITDTYRLHSTYTRSLRNLPKWLETDFKDF